MSKLDKLLNSLPNDGEMDFFDNDRFCGIVVRWSESGRGFGEYSMFVNKETGEFKIDTESDLPDTVKRTIDRLIDENPSCVKDMFHIMIDHGSIPVSDQDDDPGRCDKSVTFNGRAIDREDWQ